VRNPILFISLILIFTSCGEPPRDVEILWDKFGIPHIYAQNQNDLFYAYGWAQTHAHGDLLLRLYGQARGRGAEYWGEDYLNSDKWMWVNGVPDRSIRWAQIDLYGGPKNKWNHIRQCWKVMLPGLMNMLLKTWTKLIKNILLFCQ